MHLHTSTQITSLLCRAATSSSPVGLFTSFDLAEAGSLSFTIAPFRTGLFNVTVAAKDDGGTSNGGVDTAYVTFLLLILPEDKTPVFTVRHCDDVCILSVCVSAGAEGRVRESMCMWERACTPHQNE